jgi:Uma2 family endonuclease
MSTTATEAISRSEMEMEVEPEFPPHLMTIDRYERLVEAGVYGPKDPVFLWKGRLVEKMSKGRPHSITAIILFRILDRLLPEGWHVEMEAALRIGLDSMPEPDLMVVRGGLLDYRKHAPTARDLGIIIEVSDSSVALDRVTKLRSYAAESIPIYWIINIPNHRVEVYTDPTGSADNPSYQERREYGPEDQIPVILDGIEIGRVSVREILP